MKEIIQMLIDELGLEKSSKLHSVIKARSNTLNKEYIFMCDWEVILKFWTELGEELIKQGIIDLE